MDKKTIGIVVGLVVAIVVVLIVGAFLGWFKTKLKLVDGEGETDRNADGSIDESRYLSIAQTVKSSLSGMNYQTAYFENVANQLLDLNPNELRVVSNIYKRDFSTDDYPTLRLRIQGEFLGSTFGLPTPCTGGEQEEMDSPCYLQKKVLERLNSINA